MTLVVLIRLYEGYISRVCRQRPYHVENTGSRPITEVKQRRARLVLGWVTAWEHRVLLAPYFSLFFLGLQSHFRRRYKQHYNVIQFFSFLFTFFFFVFCCCLFEEESASSDVLTLPFSRFTFKRCCWQHVAQLDNNNNNNNNNVTVTILNNNNRKKSCM